MASKLVIDLDTLTQEKAKTFAGIILAVAGFEDGDTQAIIDPALVFGPANAAGKVDESAPHVEIPPPPPVQHLPAPPPPPPPAANVPAVAQSSVILDADKLPWDGRIHASSKATNADGTWRLKRGVDKTILDAVTAELRRAMAAPGPQLVAAPPPPPPAPVSQNIPAPPAPAAEVDARKHYVELVGRAAEAQGAGKISLDQINKCLSAVGVDNMPSLGHRLDLVTAAASLIDGIIAGTNA